MADQKVLGGRYEIDSVLGQGGMAEVYLGTDRLLGRRVAVKVLGSHFARDTSFVTRFRREAQAAAALNHPNVVSVFDTGSDDGTHYIVLEYIQGKTLARVIREDAPLLPQRAVEIVDSVAAGISFAHRNGIIHRDIKPGNIMLTPSGDVKVMDFGIARATASDSITQTATVLGTAAYFSPEQAQGGPVDARSDIYSLGCVLYEMLTAHPPFSGETPLAVAYRHVREDPVPPSQLNPDISPELDAIVLKCMAKNPDNRYQSAEELREELRRLQAGEPVTATPVLALPPTEHVDRVARPTTVMPTAATEPTESGRRWVAWAILGFLLLLLGIGLFFLARSLLRNNDPPILQVPDVIGEPLAVAQERLEDAGFESVVGERVNHPDFARNTVTDYTPKQAPEGAVITLTVSNGPAGPALVEVPDIVCQPQDQAVQALVDAGFRVEVAGDADNPDCPDGGDVARTEPPVGTEVEEGSLVRVFIVPTPPPPEEPPSAPSSPDLSAESDSGSSQEDNVTNETSLTFTGTAAADVTVTLLRDGGEVGSATADSGGNWSITDGDAPEGTFTYTAQATGEDGQTSDQSEGTQVTVDTSSPDTEITEGPEGEIEDSDVTFEFRSDEDGAGFECSLDGADFESCTSPEEYDDLEIGPHSFEVRAVDAAGNVDDSPDRSDFIVVDE
jgi:predicted Ser/Thr protein kinase